MKSRQRAAAALMAGAALMSSCALQGTEPGGDDALVSVGGSGDDGSVGQAGSASPSPVEGSATTATTTAAATEATVEDLDTEAAVGDLNGPIQSAADAETAAIETMELIYDYVETGYRGELDSAIFARYVDGRDDSLFANSAAVDGASEEQCEAARFLAGRPGIDPNTVVDREHAAEVEEVRAGLWIVTIDTTLRIFFNGQSGNSSVELRMAMTDGGYLGEVNDGGFGASDGCPFAELSEKGEAVAAELAAHLGIGE